MKKDQLCIEFDISEPASLRGLLWGSTVRLSGALYPPRLRRHCPRTDTHCWTSPHFVDQFTQAGYGFRVSMDVT